MKKRKNSQNWDVKKAKKKDGEMKLKKKHFKAFFFNKKKFYPFICSW